MVQNNITFAVVRAWTSTGHFDSNVVSTVSNFQAAGFSNVDVYMFPCFLCGGGDSQVSSAVTSLQNNGVNFTTFWFDIEGPQYWGDIPSNEAFFSAMKRQGQTMGLTMGVYTSRSQWTPIMGTLDSSDLPLWYAHYDNNPSFGDFTPFANWNSPSWKQFQGDVSTCECDVDSDWSPNPVGRAEKIHNKLIPQSIRGVKKGI